MAEANGHLLNFGPFQVDPHQRLLMRGEESISLPPKAFETLLVLLRNSGRVVGKDELMKTLWPDTFVEESNLSQHIYQLRKTLGSSPQDPQYIVTVPGKGYRFAQKVEQISSHNGSMPAGENHSRQRVDARPVKHAIRAPWLVTAMLALIATMMLGLLWRATRPVSRPLLRLNVELPNFALMEPTASASFAVSSAGNRIVYTGRGPDGKFRLYTRTLDQERAAPLAGTEGASGPFLSPDGQTAGFFADGKLKKVSVEGGEAAVLCDASTAYGGSWTEDGSIIAALGLSSGLSRISSTGGEVQPATQLKPERRDLAHLWPQVLPETGSVLFTALSTDAEIPNGTIDVQSLKTGARKTLVREGYYGRYLPSGHLLYIHGQTLYAAPMDLKRLALTGTAVPILEDIAISNISASAELDFSQTGNLVYVRKKPGNKVLMWLDKSGQTRPLGAAAAKYSTAVRWSPDGTRVALAVAGSDGIDVWVYDWKRNTMTRLTFGSYAWFPVWSPDGKHIVFMSEKDGDEANLYYVRADGTGEAVRLTQSKRRQIPYSFSPDGKRLAFFEFDPQTQADIWSLPLEEPGSDHPKAGKPQPVLVTRFDERAPMISPDGRWLAYESDESGRKQIYVQQFPELRGKWQVSTEGGDRPVWSKKAQELLYRSSEGVMAASYSSRGDVFAANKPLLWAAKKDLEPYFDLAPDGSRVAVVQAEESEQNSPEQVVLLENFFDELRRRTAKESR